MFLKKGEFDSRNGKGRFEHAYKESNDIDQVEIMAALAEMLYPTLSPDRKEMLLNTLYHLDYFRLRSVFLEYVKEDNINKKYWIPYINERLSKIRIGGNK